MRNSTRLTSAASSASNHSRAAVLCFGGWGLQTMLHLWPRLRLIQEQRQALGIAATLPDLNRLTGFAGLIPGATPDADGKVRLSGTVVRPVPDRYPEPFYLHDQIDPANRPDPEETPAHLTESEFLAARLLRRAQEDGYLQPLAIGRPFSNGDPAGPLAKARAGMCHMAASLAPAIAGALVREVIDPTRLDSEQPNNTFVQTTIYVVASLTEPLATALMWPVASELVSLLGERHIARVVGLFATGSFAHGESRMIEEAAAHAALKELEVLTGGPQQGAGTNAIKRLAASGGGQTLFDSVYLVDREKSNQALAGSSLELAILASNAIEAFLASNGTELIEQRQATRTSCGYSILGAASDYVPVAQLIAAAIRDEQKQIIRSAVLTAGEQGQGHAASLADLGAGPEEAIARAMTRRADILSTSPAESHQATEAGAGVPAWLAGIDVAREHFLPVSVIVRMKQAKTLRQWQAIAEARLQEAVVEVDDLGAAIQEAWGLPGQAGGAESDAGMAQDAAALAVEKLAEDICSAPAGILRACARAARWAGQAQAVLAELEQRTPSTGRDDRYQAGMARWQREWAGLAEKNGRGYDWGLGTAAGILALLVSCGIVAWLATRTPSPTTPQRLATILALAVAALGSAFVGWVVATQRVRGLKRQWERLAQEHLAWRARRQLQLGMVRLYGRIHDDLAALQTNIEEAIGDLTRWSAGGDSAGQPPASPDDAHLRRPHAGERIWRETQKRIAKASASGERSRGEFQRLWQPGHAAHGEGTQEGSLHGQVRAILRARLKNRPARAIPGDPALSGVLREYAALATDYLCPKHRLLADHAELAEQAARENDIEQALFGDLQAFPDGTGNHVPLSFLEDIYVRAKPAANYEITSAFSREMGEVEFGVTPEGNGSRLQHAAEQRSMPLLASHDPLSISVVRVVWGLALQDLALAERCNRAYRSLRQEERERVSLLTETEQAATLYGA